MEKKKPPKAEEESKKSSVRSYIRKAFDIIETTANIANFRQKYSSSAIAYIDQPRHKEKFPSDNEINSFMESSIYVLNKSTNEYKSVVEEIKKMISFKHHDGQPKRDINSVRFASDHTEFETSSKKHKLDDETIIKLYNQISEEKRNQSEES